MKNLPEKDFWSSIKNRLENYSETPEDDSWDKISGALPRPGPSWQKRATGIFLIFLLGTFSGYFVHDYLSTDGATLSALVKDAQSSAQNAIPDDSENSAADSSAKTAEVATSTGENKVDSKGDAPADRQQLRPDVLANQKSREVERVEGGKSRKQNPQASEDQSSSNAKRMALPLAVAKVDQQRRESQIDNGNKPEVPVSSRASVTGTSQTETNPMRKDVKAADTLHVDENEMKRDSVVEVKSEKKKDNPNKKRRIFHPDLYATLTPSLSFQKISPSGTDDIRVIGLQSEGVMSSKRFGISLEAGFQRKLSRKFDLYAGFTFYHQTQQLVYEYNSSATTVQYSDDGGYTVTPVVAVRGFDYNMTNVGITSGVFYHLTGEKLMHKIGGGLQFQKGLLTTSGEGTYDNSRSTYFNYQLSYRLECQLNRSLNVYLQPTFIHAIIAKEELNEPFDIKPYKSGLGIGLIYHF